MDEIYAHARSSTQVDESKSTRLHRFRISLEKMQDHSGANQRLTAQLEEFQQSYSHIGIDGEPIEFERHFFPGLTSLDILQKINTLNQSILKDELSSCQCSMTSIEPENCISNSE